MKLIVRALALAALLALASSAPSRADDRAIVRTVVEPRTGVPSDHKASPTVWFDASSLAKEGTYSKDELDKWGYELGAQRQFVRAIKRNPGQISVSVGAYKTAEGAQQSLARNGELCETGDWRPLSTPSGFGSDVHLCTRSGIRNHRHGTAFFLVFSYSRFKASVTVTGITNRVNSKQAIRLGRMRLDLLKRAVG